MIKEDHIKAILQKKRAEGTFRTLKYSSDCLFDFCSNDYLGLAGAAELKAQIISAYSDSRHKNGATGSRLLTGNTPYTESCEAYLASLSGFEAATLFNSGYMANLGFFSAVPRKGDTILYDELAHACIKDGCRLSLAKRLSFKHNDLDDLEKKLKVAQGAIYVACESVYSMDGDMAPLKEIAGMVNRYKGRLVVDEAHSTGIWGKGGAGLVAELELTTQVYAVIYTFGKAMGIHGACLAGSQLVKDFMINYSRPFIYTTAPGAFEVVAIRTAFEFVGKHPELSLRLFEKIRLFNTLLPTNAGPSAIKPVIIGDNEKTKQLAGQLREKGFDVRAILSPTVKQGTERLRICLHAFNTTEEIIFICEELTRAAYL